ncbi:uncharacterized protein METZ01_LOCUS186917, partial [marine metagenome]
VELLLKLADNHQDQKITAVDKGMV